MSKRKPRSKPKPSAAAPPEDFFEPFAQWRKDFPGWCEDCVRIECKAAHKAVRFELYPCQREIARRLQDGDWLWVLKARQLGFTWLACAYALWQCLALPRRTVVLLNQDKLYAQDSLDRIRFMLEHLEGPQAPRLSTDSASRLVFESGNEIRSVAATRRALRSLTADLVVFDECAFMPWLKEALRAAAPTVETSGGQLLALSTSNGPRGAFYENWTRASEGRARFKPVFYGWRARKGRDDAWYEKQRREHAGDPLLLKREYPAAPEEAFESAEGRVYPLLTRGVPFVKRLEVHPDWPKFRGIDFGGVDPFVCLWACVVPGDPPGLSLDPDCRETLRELLAYSYGPAGAPLDEDNHACDALRYLIVSAKEAGLHAHVHVYRELYEPRSAPRGLDLVELARRIVERSGSERYTATYADRSRADSIQLLCKQGVETRPHRSLQGASGTELEQGLARVNSLIVATAKDRPPPPPPPKPPRKHLDPHVPPIARPYRTPFV